MKTKITKLAAATIILIAVVMSIMFFEKTTATAYAIEQTMEANRGLRFIHLKCEPQRENSMEELWAQFDQNGELEHLRMNFPDTMDGPKDVVWQEGKAQVWFKAKNGSIVVREENVLARLKMSYLDYDPKLIVEKLYQAQADGKETIEIEESAGDGEPITITSTRNGFQTVYKVDPETKLLEQLEKYELKNGQYEFTGLIKYLDYNEPVEADIFVLNMPADVMHVDQTTQEIGLVQGDLSDDEVAVEVVMQFFEALIAEDYAGAGRLMEGLPAEKIQEGFGHMKFIRIVSISPPIAHPNPATKGVVVPCTVEVERNGQISEWNLQRLGVRQVYNQPGRWTIFGGI